MGNEIYVIDTAKTQRGGQIKAHQQVEKRERLTRRRRWETQDADVIYTGRELDRSVVNPDQIRTVVRTFRDKLPDIFPGRAEVPKTLVFAKTDSHADDVIQTVREEFGEGQPVLQEDHLPRRGRPEIRPRPVPQRLPPAHRRHR